MMKVSCSILLALAGVAHCATFMANDDDMKNRPVSKVITVLKDMITQLDKEAEEDEEIYEQMGCWCTTGSKEKTKAIAEAEAKIAGLTAAVEEMTANSARLTA